MRHGHTKSLACGYYPPALPGFFRRDGDRAAKLLPFSITIANIAHFIYKFKE